MKPTINSEQGLLVHNIEEGNPCQRQQLPRPNIQSTHANVEGKWRIHCTYFSSFDINHDESSRNWNMHNDNLCFSPSRHIIRRRPSKNYNNNGNKNRPSRYGVQLNNPFILLLLCYCWWWKYPSNRVKGLERKRGSKRTDWINKESINRWKEHKRPSHR